MPRYWVHQSEVDKKLAGRWDKSWLLGWRWVARSTDERTLICSLIPRIGAGNSLPLAVHGGDRALLVAVWSSFCLDFVVRQKLGGANMTFTTVWQLPVPRPDALRGHVTRIAECVDRLNARPSGTVDRDAIRAELDALMFHIYAVERDDIDYIMETFPIVKRKDIAAHGEYRTKRLILDAYDRLAAGAAGGGRDG